MGEQVRQVAARPCAAPPHPGLRCNRVARATKLRKHKAHLERQRDVLQAKVERIAEVLRREVG